ncbi:MAG TPA: hypothetical protein VI548_14020 [Chitinophagaceae bacterium]|nr:hypothetical protein [Chitinophagaceae bacterium]
MEVHAHSHTERKKWTHYFWEFLMLFLAVFCGFLAEYKLEHKIERERGKQYIQSVYEDLKEDTASLAITIATVSGIIENLKTIATCYNAVLKNPEVNSCMLTLFKNSRRIYTFDLTDRTIRQLANAGGFRLLRKQDADSIMKYESLFRLYKDNESTQLQNSIDNLRISYNLLVNFSANYTIFDEEGIQMKDSVPASISLFITHDNSLINKYFNDLLRYFRNLQIQRIILKNLEVKANRTIIYFKDKYHLK